VAEEIKVKISTWNFDHRLKQCNCLDYFRTLNPF